MDIYQITAGSGDRQKIFLRAGDQAAHFAILQANAETYMISGYAGSLKSFGIASVKPVQYNFRGRELDEEDISAVSRLLLSVGAGLEIQNPMSEGRGTLASQASAWAMFLEESSGVQNIIEESDDRVNLGARSISLLINRLSLLKSAGANLSLRKTPLVKIGTPVDGFSALRIQKRAAKVFSQIPDRSDLNLDQATQALAHVTRPSSQAVAWYGTSDTEVGKLRLQAAMSYPVLAGMIADSITLRNSVDQMESISDPLMKRTGLSKGALKRIGKLREKLPDGPIFEAGEEIRGEDALGINRARRTSVRGAVSLETCLSPLAAMPPDRSPARDEDWKAYSQILPACVTPISNAFGFPADKILEPAKGNWSAWMTQLARSADYPSEGFDRRQLALATIDALECVEDFSRTVILPLVLRSIEEAGQDLPPQTPEYMHSAASAAGEILLGKSKTIASTLLETGRRFASRIPALMTIEGISVEDNMTATFDRWSRYGADEFPILTEDFRASNGFFVRPLRNHEEMREESRRLNNCIGHYYLRHATNTTSHLFSVQNASGTESLADIEMAGINDKLTEEEIRSSIKIVQFNGMRNGTPKPEAVIAYNEWTAAMRNGELDLAIDEIRDWREHIKTRHAPNQESVRTHVLSWNGALGTDWKDLEKTQSYCREWSEIMPSSVMNGEDPKSLYRHEPVRRLLEELSPAAATILKRRAAEEAAARQAEKDQAAQIQEDTSPTPG